MDLLHDLKYAARGLLKQPGLTIMAVVALSLGIGLTGVMFSIVYGALHRGLPFEGAERLMVVERAHAERGIDGAGAPIHDYRDWREAQTSFEDLGAFYSGTVNLRIGEEPERLDGSFITASALLSVGEQPAMGRLFREDEEAPGAPPVLLLSWEVWQRSFGADPDVVGRTVTVNGEVAEVVGVMPEGYAFPASAEAWLPLRLDAAALERGEGTWLTVFGRLREGVGVDRASAEFASLFSRLEPLQPESNAGFTPALAPYTSTMIGGDVVGVLYTMLAAVGLVLLIACANVANLLLARASTRMRDGAIRTALGASRGRVMLQLLSESLFLTLLGAVGGLLIAWVGVGMFARAVEPTDPPFWLVFRVDLPVVLFLVGLTGLAALVAGLVPAIKASATDVNSILKDESRGASSLQLGRLSRGLVVGEIAMSAGLLVVAALVGRGVLTLAQTDFPFPTEEVLTARMGLFEAAYPDVESRRLVWSEVERELQALPGVRHAALTQALPALGSPQGPFMIDGTAYADDAALPEARTAIVSPGFFDTFGASEVAGRLFDPSDDADAEPVAVVNESFAGAHFPGTSALGRRIRVGDTGSEEPWRTIVGVVPDLWLPPINETDDPEPEGFYVPIGQSDARFMSLAVRGTTDDPTGLAGAVRAAVLAVDRDTPLYDVATLHARIEENTWFYRIFGSLFAAFGVAALFLASVGLYGIMAFSVSTRTQEMGVRMALGAQASQVLGMILKRGMLQVAVGLVAGLGLAYLLGRGVQSILYEVEPGDPLTFGLVSALLAVTALLAMLVPALRATRIDPVKALRTE